MDLVIWIRGQITTPELVPHLQTSSPHQRYYVCPPMYDLMCIGSNTGRILSGIVRDPCAHLTTTPNRLCLKPTEFIILSFGRPPLEMFMFVSFEINLDITHAAIQYDRNLQ
ncbi:hypothetical protein AVEN_271770-1 [Araneus ventricosus]|uniref:Uncharacterized protein n=1 Tax=Araneus ventricosus TaxID=182803 RepID=A0A4Y2RQS4_ARAVE|nr:hypothetical protein AVEN_271770-1 [Araneus ventricosus]